MLPRYLSYPPNGDCVSDVTVAGVELLPTEASPCHLYRFIPEYEIQIFLDMDSWPIFIEVNTPAGTDLYYATYEEIGPNRCGGCHEATRSEWSTGNWPETIEFCIN